MNAIITTGNGEHFLAELDEGGTVRRISEPLPMTVYLDRETGVVDWARFEDADMEPWLDEEQPLLAGEYTVVHEF